MDLYIPNGIKTISKVLNASGYQCYLVGGAIRNQLLGKEAKDFDLTTDAEPEIVMSLFKKVIPTGIKHGTVTILINSDSYEITTYRIDGKYSDGRRPDKIKFTPSIEEDLIRRDFTINSIAYSIEEESLLDINNGVRDLNSKIIRAIGNPSKRFSEDALRLVRACRFASQLNFNIETETYKAMKTTQEKLGEVSKERIAEELLKILSGNTPSIAFVHFFKTGMLDVLFPEIAYVAKNDKKAFYASLKDIDTIKTNNAYVKFARLLSITPREVHFKILKDLKLSNKFIHSTLHMIKFIHTDVTILDDYTIRKLLSDVSRDYINSFMELLKGLDRICEVEYELFLKEIKSQESNPLSIKELNITGNDIIQKGIKPGPEIGKILNRILQLVLRKPELNSKKQLTELI